MDVINGSCLSQLAPEPGGSSTSPSCSFFGVVVVGVVVVVVIVAVDLGETVRTGCCCRLTVSTNVGFIFFFKAVCCCCWCCCCCCCCWVVDKLLKTALDEVRPDDAFFRFIWAIVEKKTLKKSSKKSKTIEKPFLSELTQDIGITGKKSLPRRRKRSGNCSIHSFIQCFSTFGIRGTLHWFYGRQSAFCSKTFAILPPANSLTVLQTYRQAFLIPQLTCIYGNFLSQVVKSWTWEWKIPYSSWEQKIPLSNQLTLTKTLI